ncbi:hypothetical protein NDU88_001158 [Pleurodeles waltl]|uniref:Uncharacterized protein n=1 Tax=Pleurodeles waltl TaxID=8319 RepID=A0AAV7MJQ3_PLEWA|nr:hypothetical protein NDU88_001158 [Pleurodeles waltl]
MHERARGLERDLVAVALGLPLEVSGAERSATRSRRSCPGRSEEARSRHRVPNVHSDAGRGPVGNQPARAVPAETFRLQRHSVWSGSCRCAPARAAPVPEETPGGHPRGRLKTWLLSESPGAKSRYRCRPEERTVYIILLVGRTIGGRHFETVNP